MPTARFRHTLRDKPRVRLRRRAHRRPDRPHPHRRSHPESPRPLHRRRHMPIVPAFPQAVASADDSPARPWPCRKPRVLV